MTLITVLFDESRAGLGSRNSKIGMRSHQQKTLDSKKHSFLDGPVPGDSAGDYLLWDGLPKEQD
jgi:hypothetical protein